ncbi:LOW QUALITY PROTEIN: Hypothetical protein PHPALM_75 [Phytophthora palmivora]|uniref:SWIM-type domain-containing protein n=1 Tax=Phytophthora palmivora TaxID=4796 RepID=A0A2P4YVQ2_9STRA|nr:LOW QUALITY PROTEIN: Hypothetical protein PHPALM_75 [Phytophthora palmivora]
MNNYGLQQPYHANILPFAFSLVPVENYDHWVWFLNIVKEALGSIERFTVVSDRMKGLLSAVHDVYPKAGHRFCLRHIKGNINSHGISLTGKERGIINDMARADCERTFKTKPAAVDYLNGIDKKHWVKYKFQEQFKLPTYDEITSNLAEQANSWIGNDCRSAKPMDAFALYFRKLSELVSDRRQMASNWLTKFPGTDLVPLLSCESKRLIIAGDRCNVTPCMEGAYNVRFLGKTQRPGFVHPWRLVDLPAKECTCGNWQDTCFPCVHAISAAVSEGQPLDTLYDAKRMSIDYFNEISVSPMAHRCPSHNGLNRSGTPIQSDPPELGKRGLKPGPKPKHKRKKTKGGN